MNDCLNNFEISDIYNYFGESDETIKKCNKCPHLVYENGTMSCDYINNAENKNGNMLETDQTINLPLKSPLESMVVSGEYNDTTKEITLTLKNGKTVDVSVADLVTGLQK